MSLPTTGRFSAQADDLTLHFDGVTWTGQGFGFRELILPALKRETARHTGQHITLDVVAHRVLNTLFPQWQQIDCQPDQWPNALPPQAID